MLIHFMIDIGYTQKHWTSGIPKVFHVISKTKYLLKIMNLKRL